jgi:hypothetical protein
MSFAFTIFLSAFLLFQVQLIVAKHILPWFGGAAAVWTTCLLFFQVLLTAGYAYSHLLATRLRLVAQRNVHTVLLLLTAGVLAWQFCAWSVPLLPGAAWKPAGNAPPAWQVLLLLLVGVGLPFFVLSTTSSLLQAWYGRMREGRAPYWLYSLSNAGSLLSLLAYPFLVEPSLSLRGQAGGWSLFFLLFAALCIVCAFRAAGGGRETRIERPGIFAPTPSAAAGPGWWVRCLWVLLPAWASLLLLAVTNQLSGEVAVVPFLWVLPLVLYLLTFVICFSGERWYCRPVFIVAGLGALAWMTVVLYKWKDGVSLPMFAGAGCATLFTGGMICHGELFRLRPDSRRLTAFYLSVSVGGALGGIFVALIAPWIFRGYWESFLGYGGIGLTLALVMWRDERSWMRGPRRWIWRTLALLLLLALAAAVRWQIRDYQQSVVRMERNFYGVLRVVEADRGDAQAYRHKLYHGQTLHGFQFRSSHLRRLLTSYYVESSGIGLAILNHPRRTALKPDSRHLRIGVVGLGAGTLAAYGRPGDSFRFYEINPAVANMATGWNGCFSFLQDCPARVKVVLGDARISLERELAEGGSQDFDVLAVDAFSGDSPPVHLLTREAFELYLAHLRAGGVLALHVSNRYLDLPPVVWKAADVLGVPAAEIWGKSDKERAWSSVWILVTRDEAFLRIPALAAAASPREEGGRSVRLWTDDYSNLFQILKRP